MKKLPIFLLLAIIVISCALPYKITRIMPPADKVSFWENGMAVYQQEKENYMVRVGFEDSDRDNVLLDLELVNLSEDMHLIDPTQFSITYLKDGLEIGNYNAVNPEETLLKLDKAIAKTWASERNNQYLAIATAASSGLSIATGNNLDVANQNMAQGTFNAQQIASTSAELRGQKGFYQNFAIRKTSLFPETYIKGKIVFPREERADKVLLTIPFGEETFEFELFQFTFSRYN